MATSVTNRSGSAGKHIAKSKAPARHGNRLDALDGIRTIAVFLVILFHVSAPYFDAGYIGVDMFFVLSGYLITAGLVRDIRIRGRLRLARFWSRRFKRLMPAAMLTVLAVFIWGMWFAPLYRRADLGTDVWWTVFYLANWRFVNADSYFESDGTLSPLEHMWSLALEEQFYLFWPLIITVALWIVYRAHGQRIPRLLSSSGSNPGTSISTVTDEQKRLREKVLLVVIALAVLIIVASNIRLFLNYDATSLNRAYMGTDSKAFEPMIGALLAVLASYPRIAAWFTKYSHALIWGGGVVMIALFVALDGPPPMYFMGAAFVFSLAMGALIVGVAHGLHGFEARILAWAPISYLGRISYGLYLWHWPFAVWLLQPQLGFQPQRALLVILLTLGTSIVSYHLIEMPIRSGGIGKLLSPRRALISAFVTMLLVALGVSTLGGTPISRWTTPFFAKISGLETSDGLNKNTILVVGDSVPKRLTPYLAPVAKSQGWNVISAAKGSCTPMGLKMDFGPKNSTGDLCPEVLKIQNEMITQYRPDVVLWWSRYEVIDRYDTDGITLLSPDSEEFWLAQERDFKAAVDRFTADGATLAVVLTERPSAGILDESEEFLTAPIVQNMVYHSEYRDRFNSIVKKVAAERDDVVTIDGDSLFCADKPNITDAKGAVVCDDSVADKGFMRADGSHVELEQFGVQVSEDLLSKLKAALKR